jgi:hypothetical protein
MKTEVWERTFIRSPHRTRPAFEYLLFCGTPLNRRSRTFICMQSANKKEIQTPHRSCRRLGPKISMNFIVALADMIESYLHSISPLWEMHFLLLLLLRLQRRLLRGQPTANGPGRFGSQVERQVLGAFILVEQTKLIALVGVDDGEDSSN